jgi:hypothetical protein
MEFPLNGCKKCIFGESENLTDWIFAAFFAHQAGISIINCKIGKRGIGKDVPDADDFP